MNLAYEDANQKLDEVVTVADVDAEKRVGNSLVQIWKLKFGHKVNFFVWFWAQSLVKIWGWSSGEILKLKFGQYFADDALLRLWCLIFVETLKLGLVMILKFEF